MDIETFVSVLAVPVLVEELAFAHLPQVVFMQIVARISLLAKAFKPMFADVVVIVASVVVLGLLGWGWVSVWTASSAGALSSGSEIGTNGNSGGEGGKAVGAKIWRKAEVVSWSRRMSGFGVGAGDRRGST